MKNGRKYFTKRVYHYHKVMGLLDWEIYVDSTSDNCYGKIGFDTDGRVATVSYNREWIRSKDATKIEVDKTAFHEICELSLADININLSLTHADCVVSLWLHRHIRMLENVLFPLIKDKI